ncbi:hypothetical protein DPMN_142259 [Dreissena polymorpha]|uniref:Ig-like domain-containing protein n=1 Tax=Dreissena polymorpha TaxID=45954 RepID=A0A9D4GE52_DREPO|nr:hypothetical protein DPMN_142259 [Dreissena polymorpha]
MCTLRSLDTINTGDRWKCSVSINTQATFSNEITVIITVGRLAPSIMWYLDNRTPSDYSDDVDITGNSMSSTMADGTTSSIKLTLTTNDHNTRIYCNVSNGYGQIMSNMTPKINVFIYPARPTLMYNKASVISVIRNSSMTVECISSGNPMPSILWTLLNGSVISSSYISLTDATGNNQEQIVCRATSFMDPTNGFRVPVENTTVLTEKLLLRRQHLLFKLVQRIPKLNILR